MGDFLIPHTGVATSKSAEQILQKAADNGEPVFVLRAKDFFAPQVVMFYLELIEKFGPSNLEFHEDIINIAHAMKEWQGDNMGQVRYPD